MDVFIVQTMPAQSGTSHVYIIRATINSISHPLSWAQSGPSEEAGVWRCPADSVPTTDVDINLLRKPREKRHDLIYQFLGNTLWEECWQRPGEATSTCKPGGAGWAPSGHGALKGVCRPGGSLGPNPQVQAETRG